MKIVNTSASIFISILSFVCTTHAVAAPLMISDFFHDWTLNASQSTAGCSTELHGLPGYDVPGVTGVPGPGFDQSTSIRFKDADKNLRTISTDTLGSTAITLQDNQLKVTDQTRILIFTRLTKQDTYTLSPNRDLLVVSQSRGKTVTCSYVNAHPELVGQVEVGASLWVKGVKVGECRFEPAQPRVGQVNYFYNERCSFGRYAKKKTISSIGLPLRSELVKNPAATHDFEIVRSSRKLNAATENYLSLDGEIAVFDSDVDRVIPNNGQYFINPYESRAYKIDGVDASVQIEYDTEKR